MVEKALKFPFYPTPEQENLLRRTLGCVRLVYNKALATRTEAWYKRQDREKARVKVARIQAKIADCRRDHTHKLTTQLPSENQTIVVEDLAVKNMVKNHKLARAISDANWGEIVRQLTYKAEW